MPSHSTHSNEHEGLRRKLEELDARLKGVDELMRQVKRCLEDLKRNVEQRCGALEDLLKRVLDDVEVLRDGVREGARGGRRKAGYGRMGPNV